MCFKDFLFVVLEPIKQQKTSLYTEDTGVRAQGLAPLRMIDVLQMLAVLRLV
jgi:hypothetical protein